MGKVSFRDANATISWPVLDTNGNQVGVDVTPAGTVFTFEWSPLFGKYGVDFDPGPKMRAGFYSEEEFHNTFIVVEE